MRTAAEDPRASRHRVTTTHAKGALNPYALFAVLAMASPLLPLLQVAQ
jgi:hypothetical protein